MAAGALAAAAGPGRALVDLGGNAIPNTTIGDPTAQLAAPPGILRRLTLPFDGSPAERTGDTGSPEDDLLAALEDLAAAPDAGAGGGEADPSDTGDGSQPAEGDVDDGDGGREVEAAGDPGGEDDLEALLADDVEDGEGQDGQERTREQSVKALDRKNKKLRRQIAKLLPLTTLDAGSV